MRVVPFVYCVLFTALLVALYISRHNTLTKLRIRAISLERELRVQEAERRRLELECLMFVSPVRLEGIARKAQYASLRQPMQDEVLTLEEP